MRRACRTASATSVDAGEPPETGTPALQAASRAETLSPNSCSIAGLGPMNVMPDLSHITANSWLSARKP